jgi:hypothetical protein
MQSNPSLNPALYRARTFYFPSRKRAHFVVPADTNAAADADADADRDTFAWLQTLRFHATAVVHLSAAQMP